MMVFKNFPNFQVDPDFEFSELNLLNCIWHICEYVFSKHIKGTLRFQIQALRCWAKLKLKKKLKLSVKVGKIKVVCLTLFPDPVNYD